LFENKTDALNTEKAEPKKTDALVNGKTRTNEADSLHDKKQKIMSEQKKNSQKRSCRLLIQVTPSGKIIQQYKSPVMDNMPTFTGGLVGYFSYDYIKYSEPKLDLTDAEQQDFRDLDLMLFNEVIAFDHYRQKVLLITGVMTDNLDESYKRACEKLEEMTRLIQKGEKKRVPSNLSQVRNPATVSKRKIL